MSSGVEPCRPKSQLGKRAVAFDFLQGLARFQLQTPRKVALC